MTRSPATESLASPPPVAEGEAQPVARDDFQGDNAKLIGCIEALLKLDARGALVPHGIGNHARDLLSAAAVRLASPRPAVSEALVEAAARALCKWYEPDPDFRVYAGQEIGVVPVWKMYEAKAKDALTAALSSVPGKESPAPAETPVDIASMPIGAKWCQPGDMQDARRYLVRFDDPEMPDAIFTDESKAVAFYTKATLSWNCWLFAAVPVGASPAPAVGEAVALREALEETQEALRVIATGSGYEWSETREQLHRIIDAAVECASNALAARTASGAT